MTTPGGGQNINLAALWVPVMPETSHMGEEMKKAGADSKKKFEEGWNQGTSPEAMGSSFSAQLMGSINKGLGAQDIPFFSKMHEYMSQFGTDVDSKLVGKLKGE